MLGDKVRVTLHLKLRILCLHKPARLQRRDILRKTVLNLLDSICNITVELVNLNEILINTIIVDEKLKYETMASIVN